MAFRTPHKCGWILRSHPHQQYPAWRRNARRVPSCLQWRCCDASCDEFATLELSIFFRFMWKPLGTPTKTVYIYIQYIYNMFFFFDVLFLLLNVSCFICLSTRSFHRYSEKKMDWSAANMRLYQRSTHRYLTRFLWLGVMEMLGVSIYTNLFICISPIFNTS